MTWQPPNQPGWQPGWPPPVWQAPTPGCVPLRPLGVGDILDGSFRVIRRNPKVMLGLSAGVAVAQLVIVAGFQVLAYALLSDVRVTTTADATAPTSLGPLLSSDAAGLASFVASTLLSAILTGMLTVAITQDVLGVRMSARQVWDRVRPRVWRLVGLAVTVTIVPALGLVLCLAPGIWLWGIWAVAVPAFMVENTGVGAALGRSRQLVAGTFWRVWGIRALGVLIVTVLSGLIAVPFTVIGLIADDNIFTSGDATRSLPLLFLLLAALGSAVAATFTAPVRAAIDALLYVDLRMRKEGLDIALQAAVARPVAPSAPPPQTAF